MKNTVHLNFPSLLAMSVAMASTTLAAPAALAADAIVSGVVRDGAGAPMGGVTVSAKAAGSTITTSVFTDEQGAYFFPPLPAGTYRVRAQAVTFETATGSLAADGKAKQDFSLKPMKDFVRQLPGDILLAAMPSETPDDARMHRVLRSVCTGCHTASYVLQHRFDEEGWSRILGWMKQLNVYGVKVDRPPQDVINYN